MEGQRRVVDQGGHRWRRGTPSGRGGTSVTTGRTRSRMRICSVSPRRGGGGPPAANREPLGFLILTGPQQLAGLSEVLQGAGHIAKAPAALALVVPEPADERTKIVDQYDLGQATYAMMVTAADLGIGTGHSSVGDQDRARAILGVPDGSVVSYLLGVGYPADRSLKPIAKLNRRPFNEVVRRGNWTTPA